MELWIEKYRPKSIDDIILQPEYKTQVANWLKEPNKLPNILLVSLKPGTGKTSLARLIPLCLKADFMELNASDERGIQTVRDTIKDFVFTARMNPKVPKIVILDEADYLTNEAQATLRHLMEDVMENARFILTCNQQSKISDAIVSRCFVMTLNCPDKGSIMNRLSYILKAEGFENTDILSQVVDYFYPSIRDMLNWLQQWYISEGKLSLGSKSDLPGVIWNLIAQKKVEEARDIWLTSSYDVRDLLFAFARFVDKLELHKRRAIGLLLAEYDYRMAVGADPEIQLTALAWELSDIL
jgi:replication factor C small subunit